jgi:hypothetical protein
MKRVTCALVLLTGVALAAAASAQTVQVAAVEAAIRAQPDPASTPITTVKRGVVLETKGRWGTWHIVVVPGDTTVPPRTGYIAAADVATPGETPPASALSAPMPADWQARYNRALQRQHSGKTMPWIGLGVGLGGIVATAVAVRQGGQTHCAEPSSSYQTFVTCETTYNRKAMFFGMAGSLGAAFGMIAAGGRQVRQATRELEELEREKARLQIKPPERQQGLTIAAGRGVQVTYWITW